MSQLQPASLAIGSCLEPPRDGDSAKRSQPEVTVLPRSLCRCLPSVCTTLLPVSAHLSSSSLVSHVCLVDQGI